MQTNNINSKSKPGASIISLSTLVLMAAPVWAGPDLTITKLKVLSKPLQGRCNTVAITVKNIGDQPSRGSKGAIITFPQGNPFQQRSQLKIFVPALRPGKYRTMSVRRVNILPLGKVTVQAVINEPQSFTEDNFNNNISTQQVSVVDTCNAGRTNNPVNNAACDLKLEFSAPTGTSLSANQPVDFIVRAENIGSGACPQRSVKLNRYNNSTGSGYGSQIGGSGASRLIPALPAKQQTNNQVLTLTWTDDPSPGTKTYKATFTSPHNDANNFNHYPKKTVVFQ